jgi:hypothetical protein
VCRSWVASSCGSRWNSINQQFRFHAECRIMPGRCQVTLPGLALALRSQFDDKLNSA